MTSIQVQDLFTRIDNLEKRDIQEFFTLVEIMSHVTFFGEIKKGTCKNARKGQCGLFHLTNNTRNKIPITAKCRIPKCATNSDHYHLEISNMTCTFCPQWNNNKNVFGSDKQSLFTEE